VHDFELQRRQVFCLTSRHVVLIVS
jgi:hypothetical protein